MKIIMYIITDYNIMKEWYSKSITLIICKNNEWMVVGIILWLGDE